MLQTKIGKREVKPAANVDCTHEKKKKRRRKETQKGRETIVNPVRKFRVVPPFCSTAVFHRHTARARTYTHTYTHTHTHTHHHAHTQARHTTRTRTHMNTHTHTHARTHTRACTRTHENYTIARSFKNKKQFRSEKKKMAFRFLR